MAILGGLGQIFFFIFHPLLYRYRLSNVVINGIEKNHKKVYSCLNKQKAGLLLR